MQLSEIVGLEALDDAGQHVGTVVDVRLAVSGQLDDHPGEPTVFGLLVSPRTHSSYLGYERSDARKPRALAALLRWRHRGTFLALWNDVARIDVNTLSMRAEFTRYSPTLHDDD